MQQTLILFKPDAVLGKFCGSVLSRLEEADCTVQACKMIQLTPEVLREHYAHVADKPFYPEIEEFMSSSPVIAMVIAGDDVIVRLRDMLGPTNSADAPEGTIRGDFGTDMMVNVLHASDSEETAKAEIDRFFKPEEVFVY